MKTFKKVAAQGDVMFIRIDGDIPEGFSQVLPDKDNKLIVTHSETGHHHWVDGDSAVMYNNPADPLESLLMVKEPTKINHERSYDTHEPILFDAGLYKVRRQREYSPEGWRRVAD